jgi:hypothetical protein
MHISTTTNINQAVQVSTYFVNGVEYKRICKKNHRPLHIMRILDEHDNDVYDEIVPFFGPEKSVNNLNLTPGDMGHSRLRILDTKLQVLDFNRDDVIKI